MLIDRDEQTYAHWKNSPPLQAYVPDWMTKGDLARLIYPDVTYDHAIPQAVYDALLAAGTDPRGVYVWGYPAGSLLGQLLPLTHEAARAAPARLIGDYTTADVT